MRWWKKTGIAVLMFFLVLAMGRQTAYAADAEYTYTVRLCAGNIGTLTGKGIEISSKTGAAQITYGKDIVTIEGLYYGDRVYIRPQDAADVTDERYYIRGIRRSGRDNAEAETSTFDVGSDRDYVIAYGISGEMAKYTVNYQDMDGNTLRESDAYYGKIGERQYVSSRYIEGYQPQSLNMVKTLSANEAENVFTFRYVSMTAAEPETPTEPTTPETPAQEIPEAPDVSPAEAAEPEADTADAGAATAGDDAAEAVPDGEVPLGGDAQAVVPDGEGPLGQQDLEELDDGEVPLADLQADQAHRMDNLPIYIGIGTAAALALVLAVVFLNKKRKPKAVKTAEDGQDKNQS